MVISKGGIKFTLVSRWAFPYHQGGVPMHNYYLLELLKDEMEIDLISGLKKEQAAFSNLFDSSDTCEGLSAFVEKRTPDFKGK